MIRLILFILIFIGLFNDSSAQISKITVGVDGLTCPLCSRGVELSLRKLKYVEDVKMDLENTTAELIVKSNSSVSLNQILQKVDDSGFTVRFCDLEILKSDHVKITDNCITVDDLLFIVSGNNKPGETGLLKFRIADPAFNNIKDTGKNIVVIEDIKTGCSISESREQFYVIVL